MVSFDNEEEKAYFNDLIMIGEVARSTLIKVFDKFNNSSILTKDELIGFQKEVIDELRAEVKKLGKKNKN